MTATGLALLDQAFHEANRWIDEVKEDLGETSRHRAYSALRSVLHAIRDFLPFSDAAALARSLPPAVRGFFLDGWNPHEGPPKDPSREGFLARVAERLIEVPEIQPDAAARAVFRLLSRRIDEGRLPDVRTTWPAPLRLFWPSAKTEAPAERPPPRPAAEKAMRQIRNALAAGRDLSAGPAGPGA